MDRAEEESSSRRMRRPVGSLGKAASFDRSARRRTHHRCWLRSALKARPRGFDLQESLCRGVRQWRGQRRSRSMYEADAGADRTVEWRRRPKSGPSIGLAKNRDPRATCSFVDETSNYRLERRGSIKCQA
jgi:hypothetical protein